MSKLCRVNHSSLRHLFTLQHAYLSWIITCFNQLFCGIIGDEQHKNGSNIVNDATVTANANIPTQTTNFTDITLEPLPQDSGSSLPESVDVSMATTLDFFNILFKPEIFSDIRDYMNRYVIFKHDEILRNRNNP